MDRAKQGRSCIGASRLAAARSGEDKLNKGGAEDADEISRRADRSCGRDRRPSQAGMIAIEKLPALGAIGLRGRM